MHDTAVRADRNVNAGRLEILIAGLRDLDHSCRLASADALRLTRNAYGSSADTDLYKISSGLCKEHKAFPVDDISRTDLDRIAVLVADPFDRSALPLGESLRGIDTENVRTGLDEGRHTLRIISGIDTGADDIALIPVKQLVGVRLVAVIILAEDHIDQIPVIVHQRE